MKDLPPPAKAKHLLLIFAVYFLLIIFTGIFSDLPTMIAAAVLGLSLLILYFTMASYQLLADTLRLTSSDVTTRIRPFVSVGDMNALFVEHPK